MYGRNPATPLNRRGGAVKHVQTCLSAIKDRDSSFDHYGGPVKLVQACLCAENTLQRRFNLRGGVVKHVKACLSTSKDGGSFSLLLQ